MSAGLVIACISASVNVAKLYHLFLGFSRGLKRNFHEVGDQCGLVSASRQFVTPGRRRYDL
jgi:hypothetical protein